RPALRDLLRPQGSLLVNFRALYQPLDRIIAGLAPRWAYRRVEARMRIAAAELQLRAFEGATMGRRAKGWVASNLSVNAESATGLARLRARSRDLVRNNAWASKAVDAWEAHTIGTGLVPRFSIDKERDLSDEITGLWKDWAEGTQSDPAGVLTHYAQQALAAREIVESGDALFRMRVRRAEDGFDVPFQLQQLETDFLDESRVQALE